MLLAKALFFFWRQRNNHNFRWRSSSAWHQVITLNIGDWLLIGNRYIHTFKPISILNISLDDPAIWWMMSIQIAKILMHFFWYYFISYATFHNYELSYFEQRIILMMLIDVLYHTAEFVKSMIFLGVSNSFVCESYPKRASETWNTDVSFRYFDMMSTNQSMAMGFLDVFWCY